MIYNSTGCYVQVYQLDKSCKLVFSCTYEWQATFEIVKKNMIVVCFNYAHSYMEHPNE